MVKKIKWDKYIPHPSICFIGGARGSGKTVESCKILDFYHKLKKDIVVVGSKGYVNLFPKWVSQVDPKSLDVPNNCICLIDDAHLYLYAREWAEKKQLHKTIDFLARESRHKNISFILNSQQARVVDINLISMVDCIILKSPSLLQSEFERRELKKLFDEAREKLQDKGKGWSYIVWKGGKQVLDTGKPPTWFTTAISKGYKTRKVAKKQSIKNPAVKQVSDIVKIIGRFL